MGAAQSSSSYNSGPVVQARGKGGLFQLTPDQQVQNDVLSNLLKILISEGGNTLMNLKDIVTEKKCENMITILSTQISKEYQTLRFPEYLDPTKLGMVSYIGQKQFNELLEDSAQKRICDDIAEFLVRFVILIAALAASIDLPPPGVAPSLRAKSVIAASSDVQDMVSLEKDIKYIPVQKEVLNSLTFLVKDEANTSLSASVFPIMNSKFFLTKDGIIYSGDEQTNVVGVRFKYYRYYKPSSTESPPFDFSTTDEQQFNKDKNADLSAARLKEEQQAPMIYQQQPAMSLPRSPLPPAMPAGQNQNQNGGRKKSRKSSRRRTGGTRKQHRRDGAYRGSSKGNKGNKGSKGGADKNVKFVEEIYDQKELLFKGKRRLFLVELSDYNRKIVDNLPDAKLLQSLIIDENGNAWTKDYFLQSANPEDMQSDTPITEYLDAIFNKLKNDDDKYKVPTQEIKSGVTSSRRSSQEEQFQVNNGTYNLLATLSERIRGSSGDVLSPAAYRAYLLASGTSLEEKGLLTSFCKDEWARKKLSAVAPYQFLEALFVDRSGMSTSANMDKNAFIKMMIGKGVLEGSVDETSFDKVSFSRVDTSDAVSAFCKGTSQSTTNTQMINMLTQAHGTLRKMYDSHLNNVTEFLKSLLMVDPEFISTLRYAAPKADGYYPHPLIRLNPIFLTNPAGSRVALSQKISEARKMLMEHYYRVETLYYTTIEMFARASLGENVE